MSRNGIKKIILVNGHSGNRFAAAILPGGADRRADRLQGQCEICAVTLGAKGSVILSGGERVEIVAVPVERVVDTTGAGDLYASGFLYGLARGREPAACGEMGSRLAAEVIGQFGARLPFMPELD